MNKTKYWAVVLDDESRNKLLNRVKPVHSQIYAHHITLIYEPNHKQDNYWFDRIGKRVDVSVVGYKCDEKGQAISVSGSGSFNPHPHITISCRKDTKPAYSNILLADGVCGSIHPPFYLSGAIGRYTEAGEWEFDMPSFDVKESHNQNISNPDPKVEIVKRGNEQSISDNWEEFKSTELNKIIDEPSKTLTEQLEICVDLAEKLYVEAEQLKDMVVDVGINDTGDEIVDFTESVYSGSQSIINDLNETEDLVKQYKELIGDIVKRL